MNKIDNKYKIKSFGKYHKGVIDCPYCGHEPETVYNHSVGFCDSHIGMLIVIECPKCFKKWSFHARIENKYSHYYYFISAIEDKLNIHFKN